jgi:hypothetical protein
MRTRHSIVQDIDALGCGWRGGRRSPVLAGRSQSRCAGQDGPGQGRGPTVDLRRTRRTGPVPGFGAKPQGRHQSRSLTSLAPASSPRSWRRARQLPQNRCHGRTHRRSLRGNRPRIISGRGRPLAVGLDDEIGGDNGELTASRRGTAIDGNVLGTPRIGRSGDHRHGERLAGLKRAFHRLLQGNPSVLDRAKGGTWARPEINDRGRIRSPERRRP